MLTDLQARLKRAGRWVPVALLPLLPLAARAQNLNYAPANATNTAGTYTDLGTTGTVITTTSTDDANSAATPIGFTFNFNGTAFTQFVLNTNGFIKLGAAAPSAANLYYAAEATIGGDPFTSTNAADVNILAPFNVDLLSGTAGAAEYRVFTSGAAGSQVCTIQWKNVKDKTLTNSTQYDNFSFQLKLYEGSNNIEFVYGPTVAGTTGADAFRIAASGIKGSGSASGQTVMANKTSSAGAWSTTVFITGSYAGSALNYRRTAPADAGRTFRFAPTVLLSNDAAVTALYTLGKVSATYGSPVTAQVVVTNTGSTAQTSLPVTLTVSGATTYTNTQTVATLASGASTTLTFTYPVTATTGTNTVTATIPADGLASNNTQTASQTVTAADLSYFTSGTTTYTGGIGSNTAANILLLARYQVASPAVITTVTPTFVGTGTATTTYQVVVYDATGTGGTPGTLLYTSATRTRPATALADPVTVPNIAVTGGFYVGVKQLTTTNIGLGFFTETPLRPATFFISSDGTTFSDLNASTLAPRLALDVTLGSPSSTTCAPVTALAVGSITNTTASVTFTAPTGATGYVVTYTPANGTATTVTPAPTASPVSLTGLTAGTTYTVSVTNNCGTGGNSVPVTTTFTTTGGTPGPANDLCANATPLPINGNTCTNTLGTNLGATASGTTAPAPSCGGPALGTLVDVWYSAVVPANGNLTVTTSAVTGSLVDDTVIELYTGTCGSLTSIGCNDDNAVDGFSTLALTGLTPGATVYVRVRTYNATANGQFNICATSPTTTANDNPSGAVTLTVGATCTPVSSTNVGATTTTPNGYTNPGCAAAANPIDVWFKFTTAATGVGSTVVSIQVTGAPAGQVRVFSAATAAGPFTQLGCAAGTTNNTVAGPVRVGGLTPNTTYYVSVSGYGSADTQGAFTICAQGLASPAAPVFATLPYTESFEGPWLDALGVRDIPTVSWRNTPVVGDNSWRREDDGFASAGWRYVADETGATPPYPTRFSTGAHSARFHTWGSAVGLQGSLDLYANLSGTGTKSLSFDYINPTGTDKVEVLLSTDGGATFAATPILTANTSATFTNRTVVIPSTSATTVIRFRATSDFGDDDLGIDNLRLSVVTATQNAALAATVSLYPNPAHQSFQLNVPTGLHAASAQLINALGQVVQTRQLNLPVAGGTADFNVSGLAAGVYSLQLKSGNDLVVKRVVVE
jgi:hypothetical protein